jgi:DNA-binding LacI/PurR family transcriptional regulator
MELVTEKSQFLYQQVRDYLTVQARNGKLGKGGRIPSERDLADDLKISRGTIRMALSELEKSGFIERIASRGAFLCQAGKKRTIRLALVFPEAEISQGILDYANWAADNETWRGMLNACAQFNAVLSFVYCSVSNDLKFYEDFADNLFLQYDGVLFMGSQLSVLAEVLKAKNFPFITTGGVEGIKNNISYHRIEAYEQAARHLLKCGCKNTFMLAVIDRSSSWSLKKSIFRRTFAEAGFWIPDENIIELASKNEEQCLEILREKLPVDMKLPDAFFCSTPIVSFALLRLANERGWRVPKDFMIMGYANNMQLRPTVPLLTHIRIPYFNMGYQSCEILVNSIIRGGPLPDEIMIHADLIIGETTCDKGAKQALAVSRQPQIYAPIT